MLSLANIKKINSLFTGINTCFKKYLEKIKKTICKKNPHHWLQASGSGAIVISSFFLYSHPYVIFEDCFSYHRHQLLMKQYGQLQYRHQQKLEHQNMD